MCDEKILDYNTSTLSYAKNTMVPVNANCNGFTVANAGNTIVTLNGEPIQPGSTKSTGGNRKERYKGRIDLAFYPAVPPAAIPVNQAWVTQKFYLTETFDRP